MIDSAGPIILASPPVPIQAIVNVPNALIAQARPVICHGVMFQALPTNVGIVYIGSRTMDKTTLTNLFAMLPVPTANLLPSFSCAITVAPNALAVNEFWVDADEGGDGVIVTYLVL